MSEYDAFSKGFSDSRNHAWPEFEILRPYIKENTKWLDAGCGNGRLRQAFPFGDYIGADVSLGMVEQARKKQPNEKFIVMDFTDKWEFENEELDLVVGMASFHHILKQKEQKAFMAEAFRTMKSGGALILTTWVLPKKHFWKNILRGRFRVWNVPFGKEKHPRYYRKVNGEDLKKLVKEAGFLVKKVELSRGKNWVLLAIKP